MTWTLLADAMDHIAAASDDQLPVAVTDAFATLTGQPASLSAVAPNRGHSFELADGPNLFGHVVCDLAALSEPVQRAGEVLARYAAARFEAARLRQEAAQFRAVIDAADVALTVANTQWHTLYGNAGLLKLSGYTLEEWNAIPPADRICAEDFAAVEAARAANIRGESTRLRWRVIGKGGRIRWIESYAQPLMDAAGAVERIVLTSKDVTDEVQATQDLQASERAYRLLAENVTDVIVLSDLAGTIHYISSSSRRLLGYQPDEMIGHPPGDFVHPDDLPALDELLGNLPRQGEFTFEGRVQRKNGDYTWLEARARAICGADGTQETIVAVVRDVSRRRAVEEQLDDARRFAEKIADLAPDMIHVYDLVAGKNVYINRALGRILGLTPEQIRGPLTTIDYVHPDDRERVVSAATEFWEKTPDGVFENQLRMRHADGTYRWLRSLGTAFEHDPDGRVTKVLCITHDETERERLLADLRAAVTAAEAANRAKSEFLANVSHELRTPLNGILGMTELALDDTLPTHQRDRLRVAHESAAALLRVLNDLLDFSKIEAGKLTLHPVHFHLRRELDQTVRSLESRAKQKGLQLSLLLSPEVPERIVADPDRLRQVLVNLIGNALKFTERGQVAVRVCLADPLPTDPSDVIRLAFEVEDTGIGIPPEKQAMIFQPFEQADASTTRRFGGTGLGLSIAARLVRQMGGTIGVSSELGVGSRFHFEVLAQIAAAGVAALDEAPPPSPSIAIRSQRVLLAEDDPVNRRVVAEMLKRAGHEAICASDGQATIDAFMNGEYDAVLMDVQMPGIDGLEATRQIRAAESSGRRVPIVALTARASATYRAACLAAGMDEFLAKPLTAAGLAAALARATGQPAQPTSQRMPPYDASPIADLTDLRDSLGGADLLSQLAELFLTETPGLMAVLRGAVTGNDAETASRAVHRLLGSACHFHASEVTAACQRLEDCAQSGSDLRVPLSELEAALERLYDVLRGLVDRSFAALL